MDEIDCYRAAGKAASTALKYGASLIKPGAKLIDVLDRIEEKIRELDAEIAFPAQISMDHVAAHDCADTDDQRILDKQLCCLDVGAHIHGCIGDTACTVDLSGENEKLVEASRKALEAAIGVVKPGAKLCEIGKAIQETISSYGFAPVKNLSGHGLDLYKIHAPPSIPNYDNSDMSELEEDMVFAIEPFATTGQGMIKESDEANLFTLKQKKPTRNPFTRKVLSLVGKREGLPFTTRWLTHDVPKFKVAFALNEMNRMNMLETHPPLIEVKKGLVSQAEHTVLVTAEGCDVLTE